MPHDSPFRLVPDRQSWRAWDGAAVAFEPLSGDTHHIASPGGRILMLLRQGEYGKDAIDRVLTPESSVEEINQALELLLAMELVESV